MIEPPELRLSLIKNKLSWKSTLLGLIAVIILLIPSLVTLHSIKEYGVNVPNQDQWELVPLIIKESHGQLGFHDLWAQHNEHRILVPRVFMLTNAAHSHWNVKNEMTIGWTFAVLSFFVMLALLSAYKELRAQRWLLGGLALFSSINMFSYNQAENWLWGWQMQWYMANLFVLLTVLLLATKLIKGARARMITAIIAATLATYSLGNGQYAWFAGAFVVYITGQRLRYWLLAGIPVLASYYYKFNFLDGEGLHGIIQHPVLSSKYFLAYLGNPITNSRHNAMVVGLLGLIALAITLAVFFYQRNWYKNFKSSLVLISIPVAVIGYALFSGFITTMSRARLGVDQALASRYVSVGMFLWIGLALLIALLYAYQTKRIQNNIKVYVSAALSIMIVVSVVRSVNGLVYFKALSAQRLDSQQCSRASHQPPEACIKEVYFPGTTALGSRLEYVKSKHLAGY